MQDIREKASQIRLVIFDVDGVLDPDPLHHDLIRDAVRSVAERQIP